MKTQTAFRREDATKQGTVLPLMEEFYSIQGEGHYSGRPAWFIRLGGCDVGCHWCDVKESWEAGDHPMTEVRTMVKKASGSPAEMVVVTGGEPLMYDLEKLTAQLNSCGLSVHLETSGAYPLTGKWHWICLSPKKTAPPVGNIHEMADELKVIIYNRHDLEWAEEHSAKVKADCRLFLQPEWGKASEVMPLIVDYMKNNPKWKISLQIHKYLNVP